MPAISDSLHSVGPAEFLGRFPSFDTFGAEDIAAIAAIARPRRWLAGSTIFLKKDPGTEMILVRSGRVRLPILSHEGKELVLPCIDRQTLFGEIALLDGGPRTAEATAMTDVDALVIVIVIVIVQGDLHGLMARQASIGIALVRFLCGGLRDTTDQLDTIALYRLDIRLARFLLTLSHQYRSQEKGLENGATDEIQLVLQLNQSEDADAIGAARPKVNCAFSELEAADAIERRPAELIFRLSKLEYIVIGESWSA